MHKLNTFIFLLFSVITSCEGQKTTNSNSTQSETYKVISTKIESSNSKIIKTMGSGWGANICSALQDRNGNLWFGTTGEGLYVYDGKSFVNYTTNSGLNRNDVGSIFEDDDGNIWLGTGDGISIVENIKANIKDTILPKAIIVKNFQLQKNEPHTRTIVFCIFKDHSGKMWFSTNQGIFYCDQNDFRNNGEKAFKKLLDDSNIVNDSKLNLEAISSIIQDKNNVFWFASYSQEGVVRFDGKSLTNFKPGGDGMICSMFLDSKEKLWVGTKDHGVFIYDGNEVMPFKGMSNCSTCAIFSIAEEKNGNIWFGTEASNDNKYSDAWRYTVSKNGEVDSLNFVNYDVANLKMRDGVGYNSVFTIFADRSGVIWFGTRNVGLFSFDGNVLTDYNVDIASDK